jgi:hypothetical protein
MYRPPSIEAVWVRRVARGLLAIASGLGALAIAGGAAAGPSPLDQTIPLIWVMTAISVVGAVIVYAILAWAIYKFRDPAAKGRRYG